MGVHTRWAEVFSRQAWHVFRFELRDFDALNCSRGFSLPHAEQVRWFSMLMSSGV